MKADKLPLYVDMQVPGFHALRAAKAFREGELLIDLRASVELPEPDYASIDLGDRHVHHPVGRFINHSCEPTAFVDKERALIVAAKAIHSGDEITFNYLRTEKEIVSPFDCNCGQENCVGRVEKVSGGKNYNEQSPNK